MNYKLGKLPARKDVVKFKLSQYDIALPTPPKTFGHQKLVSSWGMLANDEVGDCVIAGGAHETILWNQEAQKSINFTDQSVLSDYSAITGYDPSDSSTDQGTDMQAAASYRRKTGLKDAQTNRHKVAAYIAVTPTNKTEMKQAIYLFSAVGLGIQFPASAMSQFNAGKNWTVVKSSKIEGGHYVPVIGYDTSYVYLVTWGKLIKATWGFVTKYADEALVYVSSEMLTGDKSLEGFNTAQLLADLQALK